MLVFATHPPFLRTVSPLPFSLVQLSPPPLPCVNKYAVYTYTVGMWGGGGGVLGPYADKHPPLSSLTGKFFLDDAILHCMSLIYVQPPSSSCMWPNFCQVNNKRYTILTWNISWILKRSLSEVSIVSLRLRRTVVIVTKLGKRRNSPTYR
jgi:hypothetical protein